MQISIIILNYNRADLTIECLLSLQSAYPKEFQEGKFEIIVVDNNSDAPDVKKLKEKIKDIEIRSIKLFENKENTGFSKGCNTGAKKAKGDLLLFLNNDTKVRDRGILEMCKHMKDNAQIDILGGKLSNEDGSEQPSVGKFYNPAQVLFLLLGLQRVGLINKNPNKISEVDWVKGGCMMVRKSVFEELSGFDEKLFMYIEDMELCYRAKKKGYGVFFYPHVTIVHADQGSSSRGFAVVNIYENLLYFYRKHRSGSEYLFLRSLLKTKAFILLTAGKILDNKYLISTYEKALKLV